jgi:hypothetical protein
VSNPPLPPSVESAMAWGVEDRHGKIVHSDVLKSGAEFFLSALTGLGPLDAEPYRVVPLYAQTALAAARDEGYVEGVERGALAVSQVPTGPCERFGRAGAGFMRNEAFKAVRALLPASSPPASRPAGATNGGGS